MDKGNHFYKCDLQIHSPRDRNWKGGPAVTEGERVEFAKKFVKECRSAGLQAIAISDHHDLVFFEYIKRASIEERNSDGDLIAENDRLIIFPAIELTLNSPPIQGILILDANFSESLFPTVLGALSIAQAPKTDSKTNKTNGITQNSVANLNKLYEKLDDTDGLKGRYVFFPHIKEKGHKTIMRDGFHDYYARMPCVGGYVDGFFAGGSDGYMKILNGEVDAWGYKSLGIIQTSDYRGESPLTDSSPATWIKWAKPTAEALRQACLAKESRISLTDPEMPNIYIEKVDVTASAFMGKFTLDLNPQMNSIIGGRGTGKSTILEYIRWALCDQTQNFNQDEEKSEILRKRQTLIEKTLREHSAEVRVFFLVNGTRHIIKRNINSEDVLLKIGDGDFQSVLPNQIKELLPIQAYSQKQLSSVAVKTDELKRFIEQPISKKIDEFDSEIDNLSSKVRSTYSNLAKGKIINAELDKYNTELNSYKLQISKLRSELKGMSDEDKKTIERASLFTNEKNRIDEIELDYTSIKDQLGSLKESITSLLNRQVEKRSYENETLIQEMEVEITTLLTELNTSIDSWLVKREKSNIQSSEIKMRWLLIRNEFEELYKKAKEKTTSSQQTLNSIKELESKIDRLDSIIRQKRSERTSNVSNEDEFDSLYQKFIDHQKNKTEELKAATSLFTELSGGLIKADFTQIIDNESLTGHINSVFSSHGLSIQKSRAESLCQIIAEAEDPLQKWKEAIYEFKSLNEFNLRSDSKQDLPHTPILDAATFTTANKRKCAESLVTDSIINLALIKIQYLPKFNYLTNNEMEDVIPFEDASAGQQATALLNVLLNQEGYPLIIDQPEDDIDNRQIDAIIKNIWTSKQKRQIIISSHNANLVVNGDSELVVCCDYNETSEQTNGYIKYRGSIDSNEIRDEITSVMEGGERAFKLRKEKYGF